MRYFRYKGLKTTEKEAKKAQYAQYTKEEKRLARKGDFLHAMGCVVLLTLTGGAFGLCCWGIGEIPIPESIILAILRHIGAFILGFGGLIVSCIIGGVTSSPIFEKSAKAMEKLQDPGTRFWSQACEHLCEYYGLQEPCLVTKCYDASDKEFKNHDVCIFVVGDELRITTNLKNGFIHSEKDLGCHAFRRDEISLTKIEGEKFLMAELKAGETAFLLGYRAKGFIDRNFLFRESDTQTQ